MALEAPISRHFWRSTGEDCTPEESDAFDTFISAGDRILKLCERLIEEEQTAERSGEEYAAWRSSIFHRDGFVCRKCHGVGGRLNAHHMESFADCPEKRTDVSNGITFCVKCHREFHRRYGIKHNRKWQTDEFLSEDCNG